MRSAASEQGLRIAAFGPDGRDGGEFVAQAVEHQHHGRAHEQHVGQVERALRRRGSVSTRPMVS
jgi:hypothetical protein